MKTSRIRDRVKLHYYLETDSLHIELGPGPGAETCEVSDRLNVDLDIAGGVVGFDIDHASQRLDLTTLETEALPLRSTRAGRSAARRACSLCADAGSEP